MERLFTIGAYGVDAASFFDALEGARIDLFLDLRRRRGLRGRLYSFANAGRVTEELEARRIAYRHVIELAPNPATRELQRQENAANRVAKRQQSSLSTAFVAEYMHGTLESFDWDGLIGELDAYRRPVLFCVERTPAACHRGLVAVELARRTSVPVTDLTP